MEPDAPVDTIMVHGVEIEGPFYDPKSPFEILVEKYKLGKTKMLSSSALMPVSS